MQKVIIVILFLIATAPRAATLNSIVALNAGGDVAAATSLNIPLTGLIPGVTYSVVCYIDTLFPFQYILFTSSLNDSTSTILSYSLNGNYVTQAELSVGHNTAVINGTFTNPSTASLIFTNLDQVNSFNVNNCFGIPISVTAASL